MLHGYNMPLALQSKLTEEARVSLSLLLLPRDEEGWGPLHKIKLSRRPFSFTLYPAGSCARKMQKDHVVI